MPTELRFPDESRAHVHTGVTELLKSLQESKKRKRGSPDQNGVKDISQQPGSKRGSLSNAMNGNVDNMNGDSFPETFQDPSQTMHDLEMAQLRHTSTSTHALPDTSNASTTAAAALAAQQMVSSQNNDMSFASTNSGLDGDRHIDSSFDASGDNSSQNRNLYNLAPFTAAGGTAAQVQAAREASNGGPKPAVGTEEWHKVRKDNHKEVERRRRETINEGINELAKIVPGCEKNKGSILQRAVNYIVQLKNANEKTNQVQALEKVVLEQAVDELSGRVDSLKKELKNAWTENEKLKAENERLRKSIGREDVVLVNGAEAGDGGGESGGESS